MKAGVCACVCAFALAACAILEKPVPVPEAEPEAAPETVVQMEPTEPIEPARRPTEPLSYPSKPSEPVPRASNELESLVLEFQRLRRLPASEIAREQEAARQMFNQSRSDTARLRWAMTLALPGAGSNEQGALELLDPLVKNPGSPLQGLAFLIASYAQEQRRLASQVHGLQQNVQTLQHNVQGLQQKLDALKTLERSLTGRGEPAPRKR